MRARVILMICGSTAIVLMGARGQSGRSTHGQSTILLDSTELMIGMSRDVVMSRLSQSHKLDRQENSDSWVVMGNEQPYRAFGSVNFRDGKLEAVYKKWGPQDGHTDLDMARGVYGAIASVANTGKTDCQISVGGNQQPTGEIRSAFIRCGDEYIQIDIIHSSEHGEFSDVTEVLKSRTK